MKLPFFSFKTNIIDFSFFPSIKKNRSKISQILKNNPNHPVFITDTSIVKKRLDEIGQKARIAYSFKTNYDVAQKITFPLAEVVSTLELNLALKRQYPYTSIIFNGPNKGQLGPLLSQPLTINIDNFSELDQLISYPKKIRSQIGLRLNSSLHPSRFGFNIESGEAKQALTLFQEHHLALQGLHFHIGSDIQSSEIYQKCSTSLKKFIDHNIYLKDTLKYIDFGGGYPSHGLISGSKLQSFPNIEKYLRCIYSPLRPLLHQNTSLILEPGRFLVDDSTLLVSHLVNIKSTNNTQILTLDSSINMLPSVWYRQQIIKCFDQNLAEKTSTNLLDTKIFGSTCQESDLLFQGQLPPLKTTDYLVFYCVGAYNQSQSANFIFERPPTFFI